MFARGAWLLARPLLQRVECPGGEHLAVGPLVHPANSMLFSVEIYDSGIADVPSEIRVSGSLQPEKVQTSVPSEMRVFRIAATRKSADVSSEMRVFVVLLCAAVFCGLKTGYRNY